MRLKITKQIAKDATQSIVDSEVRQLELRVLPSGTKKYTLRYWCKSTKNNRRLTLGDANEITPHRARELAAERLTEIHEPNSAPHKIASKKTISSVWEAYKEQYSDIEHSKQWNRNTEVLWDKHISVFKHLRLDSLTEVEVRKFLKSKARYSASYRNKMLQLLKNLYTFAERRRWVLESPLIHIKKDEENNAGYRLTNSELGILISNLDNSDVCKAIRIALFSGARRASVLSIHSKDVNFKSRWWVITKTKNKRKHKVYLTDEIGVTNFKGYLFATASKSGHRTDLQDEFKAYLKDCNLSAAIRFHDLKHTFVSCLYRAGIDPHLAYKMGGHKLPGMSFHYAHETDDELRDAYIQVASFIMSLCER